MNDQPRPTCGNRDRDQAHPCILKAGHLDDGYWHMERHDDHVVAWTPDGRTARFFDDGRHIGDHGRDGERVPVSQEYVAAVKDRPTYLATMQRHHLERVANGTARTRPTA